MIKLILCTLLLSSFAQATQIIKSETNTLEIAPIDSDVEIRLPKTAFDVLTKWNPRFVIFDKKNYSRSVLEMFKEINEKQMPMAFIDDVDGNDKKDIVLLGADAKNQYAVVILQKEKQWTLIKLTEWSLKDIEKTVIPSVEAPVTTKTTSATDLAQETGIPLYVLPALGEQGEKIKQKKKVGIQAEMYLGPGDVFEISNNKAVKFSL